MFAISGSARAVFFFLGLSPMLGPSFRTSLFYFCYCHKLALGAETSLCRGLQGNLANPSEGSCPAASSGICNCPALVPQPWAGALLLTAPQATLAPDAERLGSLARLTCCIQGLFQVLPLCFLGGQRWPFTSSGVRRSVSRFGGLN